MKVVSKKLGRNPLRNIDTAYMNGRGMYMDKFMKLPDYYRSQSLITDPEEYAPLYEHIPDDVSEIVDMIQGLFLHIFWVQKYGVTLNEAQYKHVQSRKVSSILAVIESLDKSPLSQQRPYEKRFIGNCRDHSVFLCSILRSKGIPARARCGFGTYFIPGHYEDHWMCEYWNSNENRWVSVDPQLDRLQKEALSISFDPLDMPKGQFITGCEAWKLCRSGAADPDSFGIMDMKGLDFVLGDFIRDIASLNKVELLPWDCWGFMLKGVNALSAKEYTLLDKAAELMLEGNERIYDIYASSPGLKAAGAIKSYVQGDATEFVI